MRTPRFTVIVPTYNRPTQLAECLAALARLEPPPGGFDVCVINDGGRAPHAEMLDAARRDGRFLSMMVLDQPNTGPGAARNSGAAAATGEYLAFTDDDCRPSPGWLRAFDHVFNRQPDALLGGRTINALPHNLCSTASQLLVEFVTGYFAGGPRGLFFASNNIAVRRADFLEAGGFDVRLGLTAGEDREFADRWWAQDRPFAGVTDALVHHAHVLSPASYCHQHFTYGRGASRVRSILREGGRAPRLDPRFYLSSLRHPFRREPALRATAVAMLTFAAHASYFTGLLLERARDTVAHDDRTPSNPRPHRPL